jgi:hypothetical protein
MSDKYRIVKVPDYAIEADGTVIPKDKFRIQRKVLGIWWYCRYAMDEKVTYYTIEDAKHYILENTKQKEEIARVMREMEQGVVK